MRKYQYIIMLVWELLPHVAEILLYYNLTDAMGILLYYHGTLVTIAKQHGNNTVLSWEYRKNTTKAWERVPKRY